MSVKSVYRKKAAFRVMYRYSTWPIGMWKDYYGFSHSYMSASEEVEKLKEQYRITLGLCQFKVLHEKLLPKRAA